MANKFECGCRELQKIMQVNIRDQRESEKGPWISAEGTRDLWRVLQKTRDHGQPETCRRYLGQLQNSG